MRHIIIKLTKVKDRMLKALRERPSVTKKGKSIRLKVDLIAETLQASGEWNGIFKMLKEKNPAIQEYYTQQNCPSEL